MLTSPPNQFASISKLVEEIEKRRRTNQKNKKKQEIITYYYYTYIQRHTLLLLFMGSNTFNPVYCKTNKCLQSFIPRTQHTPRELRLGGVAVSL